MLPFILIASQILFTSILTLYGTKTSARKGIRAYFSGKISTLSLGAQGGHRAIRALRIAGFFNSGNYRSVRSGRDWWLGDWAGRISYWYRFSILYRYSRCYSYRCDVSHGFFTSKSKEKIGMEFDILCLVSQFVKQPDPV